MSCIILDGQTQPIFCKMSWNVRFVLYRISGFENCLFGWKSRLNPTIKKLFREKKGDVDIIQFGKRIYTYTVPTEAYNLYAFGRN